MKKKLLTVLLAAVMVFGIFSLTACGGSNPDDEYNYYASKYEISGEIKIEPVNYFGVEKMFTNSGTFLLYIDNEDDGAKERFAKMNKLANEWDVTIHHFNPDMGGGYASNDTMAKVIDLTEDLTQDEIVGGSSFAAMQQELITMLNYKGTTVPNHYFVAITGAAPHIQNNPDYIAVGVNEKELHDQGYKLELYKNESGYGTYGDNIVGHIFDISRNVDGSAREEKYDYVGKTWQEIHANCYDVTEDGYERNRARYGGAITANYEYSGSEGYAYHVMARTYSHSVSGAVSLDAQNADPANTIRAVAWKKPSYAKYADPETGVIGPNGYLTQNINTFNMYGDYRLHMAGDYDTLTSDYIGEKQDLYHLVANYGQFEWLLNHNDGSFAVYFGGPWCPNSQAVMKITNDVAKDYGLSKIYVFDPRLDGGVRVAGYGMTAKRSFDKDGNQLYNDDGTMKFELNVLSLGGRPYEHMLSRNADFIQSDKNQGKESVLGSEMYGANFLYANFLENYLTDYISYWKLSKITIDRNNNGTYEANESFTEMSVPNLMAFNGEGEGKAKMLAWAEAEYHWAYTSIEGNAKREAWIAEIKHVFDQNPYASYNPIPVIPDADEDSTTANPTQPNGTVEAC